MILKLEFHKLKKLCSDLPYLDLALDEMNNIIVVKFTLGNGLANNIVTIDEDEIRSRGLTEIASCLADAYVEALKLIEEES